ncbi:AlwI family type II restriction endonuclease [Clostridium disporicum]|uniref:AlwI family type II restriction endonuclease n=1 Tax=Clostridium disporicum TaxID=84024 RepID=UPI0036173F4B
MPNTWSLSTTVRNPERLVPFIKVMEQFEGLPFNEETQCDYFKALIKSKAYKPEGLPKKFLEMYEEPEKFTDEEVCELLSNVHYKNKQYNDNQNKIYAFRARTAVGNLNKMGLCIAREAMGNVKITELGRQLINEECTFVDVMFRYFLKWQLPNPAESGYKGFNINPFIATLHVINKVNEIEKSNGNKPKGISKEEFGLFVVTLIDYCDIDETVNNIIRYREECKKSEDKIKYTDDLFIREVSEIYSIENTNTKELDKKVNNLYDYADSAIRYFRQTGLIYYRGAGRYIDLAPTRIIEIQRLLLEFDGSAKEFSDIDEYIEYLSDINQPILPWETKESLLEIHTSLRNNLIDIMEYIDKVYPGQSLHNFNLNDVVIDLSDNEIIISNKIAILRDWTNLINLDKGILQERSLGNLNKYINELNALAKRKKAKDGNGPLNLEWYTSLSLMALDDAEEIKPNLLLGDDNIPLFTAPGKGADIECRYRNFNLVTEVTLLKARDQWYAEGQPVMRHLREFEEKYPDKETFCLFIAPTIHRDTINTFWMSIKMGYEGVIQKIVPLTIEQYTKVLNLVLELNKNNVRVTSNDILDLLQGLFDYHNKANLDVNIWLNEFDNIIDNWYITRNNKV